MSVGCGEEEREGREMISIVFYDEMSPSSGSSEQ